LSKRRLTPLALAATAATVVVGVVAGSGSATPAQETIKAGLVSDVGRFNDKGFNQFQLEGLQRAKKQLGVQTRAIESRSAGEYIPNMTSLARQQFDIIISAGFLLAEATNKVARRFPDATFAITDYSAFAPPFNGKQKNVVGLTYAANENSYLIGCLAALMTKRQGGKQLISVTAGVKIPPVDVFLAGYRAGAKKCHPQIQVIFGYSQDFIAQDKCKEIALNQIARGSQVVFNVAGPCGLGALDAAKQKKVWGIGVDKDQSFLGAHILTSAVKRVDQGIFLTIKQVKDGGEVQGGRDLVFNLKNGGVSVGKVSSKVPRSFVARMNALKKQIIAGKIKVPTKV
jgi:basic membrane protein A and related proteins